MALFKKEKNEEVKHNIPLFNSHKKEAMSDIKDMNSTRGVENMIIGVNRYMNRTPWTGRGERPAQKIADSMKKKINDGILSRDIEKDDDVDLFKVPF